MTSITELASAAWASRRGGRRLVAVRDLQEGMAIALPFREFRLPWLVIAEPVPITTDASMVMLRRIIQGNASGAPVAVRFLHTAPVARLARHFGQCTRCGGLSPCVDEWVELALVDPFEEPSMSVSESSLAASGEEVAE